MSLWHLINIIILQQVRINIGQLLPLHTNLLILWINTWFRWSLLENLYCSTILPYLETIVMTSSHKRVSLSLLYYFSNIFNYCKRFNYVLDCEKYFWTDIYLLITVTTDMLQRRKLYLPQKLKKQTSKLCSITFTSHILAWNNSANVILCLPFCGEQLEGNSFVSLLHSNILGKDLWQVSLLYFAGECNWSKTPGSDLEDWQKTHC